MVNIASPNPDPTLAAMNAALVEASRRQSRRPYLGMSEIGKECSRALWYGFRWVQIVTFDAETLKRFADGHLQEDVMADRLRAIPGITLRTIDPATNYQIGYSDFGGHFKGHMDGEITGLLQAPKTPHVWEHKSCGDKVFGKLKAEAAKVGEKNALQQWNVTYYAQHVLYMDYGKYKRGYLTVTTPGGRDEFAVRTNADPKAAQKYRTRAERIIFGDEPPEKISPTPDFYQCRWCAHSNICHGGAAAARNCRTCMHVTARREGGWQCDMPGREPFVISDVTQAIGCASHRYNPHLVPGAVIDGNVKENWVLYQMPNCATWRDVG